MYNGLHPSQCCVERIEATIRNHLQKKLRWYTHRHIQLSFVIIKVIHLTAFDVNQFSKIYCTTLLK